MVEPEKVKERWKGYMEGLLNVENDWDGIVDGEKVEGPQERITEHEVENAIRQMKSGKAGGPTNVVGEMICAAGKKGVKIDDKGV